MLLRSSLRLVVTAVCLGFVLTQGVLAQDGPPRPHLWPKAYFDAGADLYIAECKPQPGLVSVQVPAKVILQAFYVPAAVTEFTITDKAGKQVHSWSRERSSEPEGVIAFSDDWRILPLEVLSQVELLNGGTVSVQFQPSAGERAFAMRGMTVTGSVDGLPSFLTDIAPPMERTWEQASRQRLLADLASSNKTNYQGVTWRLKRGQVERRLTPAARTGSVVSVLAVTGIGREDFLSKTGQRYVTRTADERNLDFIEFMNNAEIVITCDGHISMDVPLRVLYNSHLELRNCEPISTPASFVGNRKGMTLPEIDSEIEPEWPALVWTLPIPFHRNLEIFLKYNGEHEETLASLAYIVTDLAPSAVNVKLNVESTSGVVFPRDTHDLRQAVVVGMFTAHNRPNIDLVDETSGTAWPLYTPHVVGNVTYADFVANRPRMGRWYFNDPIVVGANERRLRLAPHGWLQDNERHFSAAFDRETYIAYYTLEHKIPSEDE